MTPKWPKSVKSCMLEALENGLLGHPFPERVAKRPFVRWLRAHPSLFFSVPVPLDPPLRLLHPSIAYVDLLYDHQLYNGVGKTVNPPAFLVIPPLDFLSFHPSISCHSTHHFLVIPPTHFFLNVLI